MSSKRVVSSGLLLWAVMACVGCATKPSSSFDYSEFRAQMPRSILVLPPLNESVEVDAPYSYLTTVSRPIAERGYYVFPVSIVDAFMKDNGLPSAGEMHGVSLSRIEELIGADAVLYLTIADWGQKYQVLNSQTVVSVEGRLVDVPSGTTLWTGDVKVVRDSSDGDSNLAEMLVGAVVAQIVRTTVLDHTRSLARQANRRMFFNEGDGLLVGPLHPEFGTTGDD